MMMMTKVIVVQYSILVAFDAFYMTFVQSLGGKGRSYKLSFVGIKLNVPIDDFISSFKCCYCCRILFFKTLECKRITFCDIASGSTLNVRPLQNVT